MREKVVYIYMYIPFYNNPLLYIFILPIARCSFKFSFWKSRFSHWGLSHCFCSLPFSTPLFFPNTDEVILRVTFEEMEYMTAGSRQQLKTWLI